MRTRSANPPNSDSGKKVVPKKGPTKAPTKPDVPDPVTETAPAVTKLDTTTGDKTLKADEQARLTTQKIGPPKSEAEDKMQAEEAKETKGSSGEAKSTEKKVTPKAKVAAVAKTKVAPQPKGKAPEDSKPNVIDNSKAKSTEPAKGEGSKPAAKIGQKEVKVVETEAKGVQNGQGKLVKDKIKEESSLVKSADKGGDIKVEISIEPHDKSVEATKNEEEFDGEDEEEELEPEDADQEEGAEMEEYDGEEGYEEVEGEEGGEEEDLEVEEEEVDEEEEHHDIEMPAVVKERRRKKELEVFVGGLDKDAVEEDLRKVFEQVGEVLEVRLLRNPLTNKNKGFAFIGYATKEQAKRAVAELKNPLVRGKRCGVAPSEDNDTLFLGNICKTWTKEAVKEKLKEYGIDGIEELTLVGDTQNEGLSRGFAFLEFSTHLDAMNAYKRLQRPDVVFGADRTAKVAFAEPLHEPDEEIMAQVKSVFVDGLPAFWDEDRVKERLKKYGEIERVVLARNMPTAKRRDFGFVNFTTHEAAVACIEGLNNTVLVDGETKLRVKVRLANPLPKSQAVKGGMRGGFPIGRSGLGIRVPGWKLGVGRHPFKKVGIPRGRGFIPRGRGRGFVGRGGKFSYRDDDVNNLFREFREGIAYNDRRAPMGRGRGRRLAGGLRRGSFRDYTRHNDAYQSRTGPPLRQGEDFATRAAYGSRRGSLTRGGGRAGQSRRHSFPPSDGLFSRRLDRDLEHSRFRRGSYAYNDVSHGAKRPYAALDEDSRYVEPGSRGHTRARYDYSDPITSGARYPGQQTLASTYDGLGADSLGTSSGLYPSSYAGTRDYYGTDLGGSSYSSLYGGSRSLGSGSYY